MKTYWWNTTPNLGDRLTELLLHEQRPEWVPHTEAEFVGIGSLVELFDGFTGTVFGTGRAGPTAPPTDLRRANVLALRGRLSLDRTLITGETVLGDPALLMADKVEAVRSLDPYTAIVPHWQDQDRMATLYPGARFVDVTGDPMEAVETIAAADRVVSSSLHGIILADAFRLPRMWERFPRVQANGFKFRDYASVVGKFEPDEWVQADTSLIDRIRRELRGALSALDQTGNLLASQ